MKFISLLIILFPLFLYAQDTTAAACKLIKEKDPYTRETKLSSGFISLQTGASLNIDADSKEIDFFFTVPDECYTDASTVFIFFEGTKVKATYRNTGSMNCDGYFHFNFRNGAGTPSGLQKLATQKVTSFVFSGNDKKKPTTISLLPDQQKILREITACMIAESKTLIKK
ncbi:MAG: hypothetical protein ABI675_06765 [Chitinophagaceae bacterium]